MRFYQNRFFPEGASSEQKIVIQRLVIEAMEKMLDRLFGRELEEPSVTILPPMSEDSYGQAQFEFKCDFMNYDTIKRLAELDTLDSEVDVDIRAPMEKERYLEQYAFLKEQDPEAWAEAQKYEYDGKFEVTIEVFIKPEKWKELVKDGTTSGA